MLISAFLGFSVKQCEIIHTLFLNVDMLCLFACQRDRVSMETGGDCVFHISLSMIA